MAISAALPRRPEVVDARQSITEAGIPFSAGLLSDSLGLVEILRAGSVERDLKFVVGSDATSSRVALPDGRPG